ENMKDYLARCAMLRSAMAGEGVDSFLASPSSDMLYLSGCPLKPSERLALLVLPPEVSPFLLVPALESPDLGGLAGLFAVHPWADPLDPIELLRVVLGDAKALTVAVSDQLWAAYLLQLQGGFPNARFIPGSRLLRTLRMVKDPEEIETLSEVSAMADRVFQKVLSIKVEGLTESQLSARLAIFMMEEGFESLDFRIVASGENGAAPHHFPGERRIEKGDPIVMDYGGTYRGYYADTTRTICVGEPSSEFRDVYEIVRRAQEAGIAAAKPGVEASIVDAAARSIIEDAGYGDYFIHRTGHGIGLDVHEDPPIGKASATILKEGMAFTVEPGIYLPGRFGVRIEDVVVLTTQGAQRLNQSPRELMSV
ncbi:MAG: Xaa-Pro peptidase family protein, partial [Dehalococcoidia bacterium]|nr:Xaa-Pro peptidase family protein [Dehalococcoidia bacterium]